MSKAEVREPERIVCERIVVGCHVCMLVAIEGTLHWCASIVAHMIANDLKRRSSGGCDVFIVGRSLATVAAEIIRSPKWAFCMWNT